MKKNKALNLALSLVSFCLLLSLLASCAGSNGGEAASGEWQGDDGFEIKNREDEELLARYGEYKENAALAFSNTEVEDGGLFGIEPYGEGVMIVSYSGEETIISLPEEIDGKRVLALGKETFSDSDVRAVELPDSLEFIEKGAFEGCDKLSTLSLPFVGDGKEIREFGYIFGSDKYDTHGVSVPTSLDMVIISGEIEEIAENAFAGCKTISAVILPDSVVRIGDFAFYECRDLVYFSAEGELEIGEYSFGYCSELYSFESRNAVSVGLGAFYSCNSLETLALPFVGGGNAESGYLGYIFGAETPDYNGEFVPASLRRVSVVGRSPIADRAFAGCRYIREIELFDGIEEIGVRAFYACRSLEEIALPEQLTLLDDDAFFGCDNLRSVELGGELSAIGMQAFYGCRSLESIAIPDRVEEIKPSTFALCSSLESIDLNRVKRVGKDAFSGCESLEPQDCEGISVDEGNSALIKTEDTVEE